MDKTIFPIAEYVGEVPRYAHNVGTWVQIPALQFDKRISCLSHFLSVDDNKGSQQYKGNT